MAQLRDTFAFVFPEPIAEPFESGREVEWQWGKLEETARTQQHMSDLLPLVVEAKKRVELRNLFPFTSHVSLCFSRCAGYPYSGDCPYAVPMKSGSYSVFDSTGKLIGRGDTEVAVQLLITHLPPGSGRAVKGTRGDL